MDQQRLQRLIDLGRSLVAELDLDEVLARVLETARDLTEARYAALGIIAPSGTELERFLTSGIDREAHAAIGELPRGRGVLGVLITDPKPLRLEDVGDHIRSYGFPPGHPPMKTFLGVPITIRGAVYGNLYLTEKSGGPFTPEDEQAVVVLSDWAAIAIDNARRHSAVTGRRDELERAVAGFEATTDLARAVAGETRLDRVVELIAKRGRALVEARTAAVFLREGDEVIVAGAAGEHREAIVGNRQAIGDSLAGEVIRSGRAKHLHDITRLRAPVGRAVGATAGIYFPLNFRGRPIGVLAAFDRVGGPEFSDDDERLLSAFSASAAAALATAQNVAEAELRRSMEAAEAERRRWARELHDETLQQLGGLRMILSNARNRDDAERMREAVDTALEHITDAISELRRLITDLRPAALDQLGVGPAVRTLIERVRDVTDLDVALDVHLAYEDGRNASRLVPEIEDAAYRIVQEALNNVLKHAGAERVEVSLAETDGTLTITVSDDGRGFEPEGAHAGFGLVGMRERASLVSGQLVVRSSAERGTVVQARLPARHAGDAHAA